MKENNTDILAGGTIPPPEIDPELVESKIEEGSNLFDYLELAKTVGTKKFPTYWKLFSESILEQPIENQKSFCIRALERFDEQYDFEFQELDFNEKETISNVIDLIKFVGFEYVDYFTSIWKEFKVNLFRIDIDNWCQANCEVIIEISTKKISEFNFSVLVSHFLRTYYKEGFIKMFVDLTNRMKTEIQIKLMEESNE